MQRVLHATAAAALLECELQWGNIDFQPCRLLSQAWCQSHLSHLSRESYGDMPWLLKHSSCLLYSTHQISELLYILDSKCWCSKEQQELWLNTKLAKFASQWTQHEVWDEPQLCWHPQDLVLLHVCCMQPLQSSPGSREWVGLCLFFSTKMQKRSSKQH